MSAIIVRLNPLRRTYLKMNERNVSVTGLSRVLASYLLLASSIFFSLPLAANAQMGTDELQRSADKIQLRKETRQSVNKMSGGTFASARKAAQEENAGIATTKAAAGESSYAVLNIEFKTPV